MAHTFEDRHRKKSPLLTAHQVARRLNIKTTTVYALCRRNAIPHIKVTEGRRRALIRFSEEAIEAAIRERSIPSVTADGTED